ncbi:uncharacterized protein FTOL_13877 [Fusarium torulosum]
MSSQY